jgi:hypothetical protein
MLRSFPPSLPATAPVIYGPRAERRKIEPRRRYPAFSTRTAQTLNSGIFA